jgi:hypothetical protein
MSSVIHMVNRMRGFLKSSESVLRLIIMCDELYIICTFITYFSNAMMN